MAEPPTPVERQLIPVLRRRSQDLNLSEGEHGDQFLLRWLRARELNVDEAEASLRQSMRWREENDIANVLSWEAPPFFHLEYPAAVSGFDEDNSPVLVIPFGRFNLKRIISEGLKQTFLRYVDQIFAQAEQQCRFKKQRNGMLSTQFNIIYDADKLSMLSLASFGVIDMILEVVRRFEANHPESLKAAYVINAGSRVFSILFGVVKPILSQRTFGKVTVLDSRPEKWKKVLHKSIPLSALPLYLGGINKTHLEQYVGFI